MRKYNFYSGLLGYGIQGSSGLNGISGASIYFTDFDTIFNKTLVKLSIENNYVMWASYPPNTVLPNGRQYMDGDILIDSRGAIWEIDKTGNDYFFTGFKLTKSNFFDTYNVTSTYDFERWYNRINSSEGYIIDNIRSDNTSKLFSLTNIYDIRPFDFTRIEFTDFSINNIYPFTVYSSTLFENDVFNIFSILYNDNKFKIGSNINETLFASLIFDTSTLIVNRDKFNEGDGEILSNNEIDSIFDPLFNDEPDTFKNYVSTGYSITIAWNLSEFTNIEGIKGTLYFSKSSSDNISLNDTNEYVILHNVDAVGNVTIDNLTENDQFIYYMKVEKDGWERESKRITAINSINDYKILILDPFDKSLQANNLGVFTEGGFPFITYEMDILTDVADTWIATPSNNWITLTGPTSGSSGTFQIDVSLSVYSGQYPRNGYIKIESLGVPTEYVSVSQSNLITIAQFNNAGNLVFSPALTDQIVSATFKLYSYARAKRDYSEDDLIADTITKLFRNNNLQGEVFAQAQTSGVSFVEDENYILVTINNINASDTILCDVLGMNNENPNGPDCLYVNNNTWMEGLGYIELISISKTSGSGIVLPGLGRFWYSKRAKTPCLLDEAALSYTPTI